MTTMMPEPKLFTKVETFRGVEMETIYRQGKVPVDPKDENRTWNEFHGNGCMS